ncbi:MAG: hypothetical protein DRQ78_03520 [Epsilonproteobacteria bacterium]|nr:MAG: hypothetical protein DRQ78_03520 [Campylobacterota bacterium]
MFIVEPNLNREMKIVLRGLKRSLGHVPPHFELYATLHPKRFKMFLEEIIYLSTHESINPDFFAFTRFYIAAQENFTYCYVFNKELLLGKGYTQEDLEAFENSADKLPLDKKHQVLFVSVLTAIESPKDFDERSIEKLKVLGWSDSDIFDAIDHGAFLFKFSKILKAYAKA